MSNYYNVYCIGFSYKSLSYRYSKNNDLFEICKKLNITKISSKNKTHLIDFINLVVYSFFLSFFGMLVVYIPLIFQGSHPLTFVNS